EEVTLSDDSTCRQEPICLWSVNPVGTIVGLLALVAGQLTWVAARLRDASIPSRVNQRLEPVVGYHPGRPCSLLASTAACVSLLACSCSGWTVIATAKLSSFYFATS